ncbi:MAG: SDR family oxidoreductase [Flavobacteriaceae bacterium]|nr:SDR family oxidoreductase [Flavobacteriaceae bacterium]
MPEVVLITGASSGLGLTTARFLTEKGYTVYGTSRNPNNYPELNEFSLLPLDVLDKDSISRCVKKIISKSNKIDVLICNAGLGIVGPLELVNHQQVSRLFETNCFGVISVIQEVLPHMREAKKGFILNISSIAGYMGLPYRGVYSSSKAALDKLTESLRLEVAEFGIRVSTLAPGSFATPITNRRIKVEVPESSSYHETYTRIHKQINQDVDGGGNPIEVAKKVHQIIKKRNPKVHYRVGPPMQKLSIVLKDLLPSKTYEKLLKNHYKLH